MGEQKQWAAGAPPDSTVAATPAPPVTPTDEPAAEQDYNILE